MNSAYFIDMAHSHKEKDKLAMLFSRALFYLDGLLSILLFIRGLNMTDVIDFRWTW